MSEKIKPHHPERKAIVYIRRSSAYQVKHNLEKPEVAVWHGGTLAADADVGSRLICDDCWVT
jgi:hypothetical protein